MKIYLASISTFYKIIEKHKPSFVLETFYFFRNNNGKTANKIKRDIDKFDSFMLDSGAFTFMEDKNKKVNWKNYVEKYAKFINENDINLFFELDIDSVVGYDKVLELRKILEKRTNKKCIPVWHKSRGKEEFIKLVNNYSYVAIGGIVSGEIKRKNYKYFNWFINKAHKNNCKIHGLGFTSLKKLPKYSFDSVDSTSWLSGGRFGTIYHFNGRTLKSKSSPEGMRSIDYKKVHEKNLKEWKKFQNYALKRL